MTLTRRQNAITIPASADLSSNQFRLVGVDSAGRLVVIANAATPFLGILMNKPSAIDREAEVAVASATVKLEAGATIAEGDLITGVAGGRGSPSTTDTDEVVGMAISPGGSGVLVEVNIAPRQHAG